MSTLYLVNVLDWARSLGREPEGATPESVADWMEAEYLRDRGGGFNYDPAIKCSFDLFRGTMGESEAVQYCEAHGSPAGRKQNIAAIRTISGFAARNISTCYRVGFVAVPIGRFRDKSIYVGIKASMLRVRHDEAFMVVPGFRLTHRPAEREIDAACSLVLAQLARDDFADADFEYLYAGPGVSEGRVLRAIHGRDRQIFGRDAVDALVDTYVRGITLLLSRGKGAAEPNFRGYRIYDPNQLSLFG